MSINQCYICMVLGEGVYIMPKCTIFGLEDEEKNWLIQHQEKLTLVKKLTDMNNNPHDGIEIATSAYKVINCLYYES